jgi:citrate lyase beta subunit
VTAVSRPRRLRRTVLVFPATELRMAKKAAASAADCVVFDLEDSVPPDRKQQARTTLREALGQLDFGEKEICVRINAVDSTHFDEDVQSLDGLKVHAIVVPKVETAREVQRVEAALAARKSEAVLHLAIETPLGLFACRDFAQASARVDALIFGAGDFVAASGFSADEGALIHPRSQISLVASSLSLDALDLVHVDVNDPQGLARSTAAGRALGYRGKWVIHPGQVEIVNRGFDPSPAEISRASRILETLQEAAREGRGAIALDGALIDEASVRWAQSVVARAAQPGRV